MNAIDEAILRGETPPEPDAEPAPAGVSYYWDARREGLSHEAAVRRAARHMGAALDALRAVTRSK